MKKILITGKNSYIGTSFEKWITQYPNEYSIDTIDMKDGIWREHDFSTYDVIFHVAGIAHVSCNKKLKDLYYKVNRDLTIDTAKKAKAEGVKQFIFMSSIIVYGNGVDKSGMITKDTVPQPKDFYGDSKLQAENGILPLNDENFKVVVLRPPMIYGPGSKGNFPKLVKIAKITPIFPDVDNKRSMLYIDNLCEFIRLCILSNNSGILYPQNSEYVATSKIVKEISKVNGNFLILTRRFNLLITPFVQKVNVLNKLFGNCAYDFNLSGDSNSYCVVNLEDSIIRCERKGP
jgi:nucleoside-diphosphate-sugar epimerase